MKELKEEKNYQRKVNIVNSNLYLEKQEVSREVERLQRIIKNTDKIITEQNIKHLHLQKKLEIVKEVLDL